MTDTLAEDWIALWQSELAAMAADRELRECWVSLLTVWANAAGATAQMLRRQDADGDGGAAARAAGAAEPAGAAAAAAASQPGGDEAGWLHERIAALESRLAAFERRGELEPARTRDA